MTPDDLFDSYDLYEEAPWEDTVLTAVRQNGVVISTKTIADGANDLSQVADMLRIYADFLDTMHDDGFTLAEPILEGKGFAFNEEND